MGREVALELSGVCGVARAGAEDDSASLDPALVFGGALLRNPGANQAPQQ